MESRTLRDADDALKVMLRCAFGSAGVGWIVYAIHAHLDRRVMVGVVVVIVAGAIVLAPRLRAYAMRRLSERE